MAERIRQRVDDPVIHQRLMISGFPNSLIDGAANASRKFPPSAQMGVNWVTLFLEYLWSHGHFRFDVDAAEEAVVLLELAVHLLYADDSSARQPQQQWQQTDT